MKGTQTTAKRRSSSKRTDSAAVRVEPGGFTVNEYLELKLKLRDTDHAKYMRETSEPLRITVERYAELKAQALSGVVAG